MGHSRLTSGEKEGKPSAVPRDCSGQVFAGRFFQSPALAKGLAKGKASHGALPYCVSSVFLFNGVLSPP